MTSWANDPRNCNQYKSGGKEMNFSKHLTTQPNLSLCEDCPLSVKLCPFKNNHGKTIDAKKTKECLQLLFIG